MGQRPSRLKNDSANRKRSVIRPFVPIIQSSNVRAKERTKLMTSGAKENSRRSTGTGSGASVPPPPKEQRRTVKQRQEDVDEIVDVMKVNVDKVLERDQKLGELEERAENLKDGAQQFEDNATKLKRKYWWENMKWKLIIAAVVIACVAILVVVLIIKLA
ncbi:vesicle-associated membrane protein 3-like [Convolutriloba macropyga]|uniref:vesicle-associated membrane protein 3-like n=1 Tax=Convolutriloba macropyga TaxID=536237 RepID=UPI003F52540A